MEEAIQKRSVTVFGAGVAGLTVAHELAVRGYDVAVWEPEPDTSTPANRCGVGGMARTQYATINDPVTPRAPAPGLQQAMKLVPSPSTRIGFAPMSAALDHHASDAIADFAKKLSSPEFNRFDVEIHGCPGEKGNSALAFERATVVMDSLVKAGIDQARLSVYADRNFAGAGDRVDFVVRQYVFPGEHGFRFFPAFYRHVFDTMKRTPLMNAVPRSPAEAAQIEAFADAPGAALEPGNRRSSAVRYVETGQTAFDNLVSTTSQALAFDDNVADVDVIPRRRIQSLEVLRSALRMFLSKMGFTLEDMSKLSVKLTKYMTSSTARREKEYQNQSWWTFIEADALSPEGQARVDAWPRALVAMSSREADARTQGNIIVQLLLDQLMERDYTDGTLNAPTTEAWLAPWRTFLEQAQGVRFFKGKLEGFEFAGGVLSPLVTSAEEQEIVFGPLVVALPLGEAQRIATNLIEVGRRANLPDSVTLQALSAFPAGAVNTASPTGALKHLVGIQFYFSEDVQWVNGHIYFPDSEWQLTAISQAKFWQRQDTFRDGYFGSLSVCIGDLGAPAGAASPVSGQSAWQLTKDEIAQEVWRQISEALSGRVVAHQGDFLVPRGGLPVPIAYHLDDNLKGEPGKRENLSPLLINKPGSWKLRPGFMKEQPDTLPVYELVLGGIVFAGTYMQTYTRLTTMEAANESGRHAVNTILVAADSFPQIAAKRGNLCPVWDPEDNEIEDLLFLKEIDRKLLERGLPHFLDIISIDSVTTSGLDAVFDTMRLPFDKSVLLDAVSIVRRVLFR